MIDAITQARTYLDEADALLIGASNGLSIAEGYHIFANNTMFQTQFGDMQATYGIRNVIEGCFYRYPTKAAQDAFFERLIAHWVTAYKPSNVMLDLLAVVGQKDYFVVTSNGDTHLELSGFAPERVFEIEGTFHTRFQSVDDKSEALQAFLARYAGKKLVVLELGIGQHNRLIKLPLMQLVHREPHAKYITLNLAHELYIPAEIANKSIGLAGDIAQTLQRLKAEK